MSSIKAWKSPTVALRSTAWCTCRIMGSYALTPSRIACVRWSGLLRHNTRTISSLSRIDNWSDRYSSALLCCASVRSAFAFDSDNMTATIDMSCSPGESFGQLRTFQHTVTRYYSLLFFRHSKCSSRLALVHCLRASRTSLLGASLSFSILSARFLSSRLSQPRTVDMICCSRFMPSSAPLLMPIQFVMEATLTFASINLIIPLIMVATFPMRSVCLIKP